LELASTLESFLNKILERINKRIDLWKKFALFEALGYSVWVNRMIQKPFAIEIGPQG
jgi:hypothetical protein